MLMNEARVTRRDVLKLGGAALTTGVAGTAVSLLSSLPSLAQTPKRGGVLRIRGEDPLGLDPHQTVSYKTMTNLSFTHSRLVKVKAGPSVAPGTYPLEPDLAESWDQQNGTTYIFKLKRGVRWHPKPPVNGRELTAEDVKYTYERFLTIKGNPNRSALEQVAKIEALDRYTVRFTMKEPFAWFLNKLAATSTWVIPRESVEQHGDLKKPEACIGTGPWMLEQYLPGVRLTFVRNPHYFLPGLPYADGVEVTIDQDASSRFARWIAGGYDFAPEHQQVVSRVYLDVALKRKPGLQTADYVWFTGGVIAFKLDDEPFRDVRVRRAMARASSDKEILQAIATADGLGVPNPAIPAAAAEWSIPIDLLPPEGRELYEQDVGAARRLLADAGYSNGFKVSVETTGGWGPEHVDGLQVSMKNWKAIGIETELRLKEYGAFLSNLMAGRFDKLVSYLRGTSLDPDSYLSSFLPGEPWNVSGVQDPRLNEMIRLQRRTFDVPKRREILYEIQRYLSQRVYYLYRPSARVVSAWAPYVRNFAPNNGFDTGGRLMATWLDK